MIFITVGTEKFPFDRLLRAVDSALLKGKISHTVFCQRGTSRYMPERYPSVPFLPFNDMTLQISQADIVISHAGIGSTLLCTRLGRIPILFPRDPARGEHLDGHQLEFARRIEQESRVLTAYDEQELIEKICHYDELVGRMELSGSSRRPELVEFLDGLLEGE